MEVRRASRRIGDQRILCGGGAKRFEGLAEPVLDGQRESALVGGRCEDARLGGEVVDEREVLQRLFRCETWPVERFQHRGQQRLQRLLRAAVIGGRRLGQLQANQVRRDRVGGIERPRGLERRGGLCPLSHLVVQTSEIDMERRTRRLGGDSLPHRGDGGVELTRVGVEERPVPRRGPRAQLRFRVPARLFPDVEAGGHALERGGHVRPLVPVGAEQGRMERDEGVDERELLGGRHR